MLRKKILREQDGFENFFAIRADFSEGEYMLRAYTNWMRNMGEENFFTAPVKIYDNIASVLLINCRFEVDEKGRRYAVITLMRPNGLPYEKKSVTYMVRTKPTGNRFRRQRTDREGVIRIRIPEKMELEQYVDLTLKDGDLKINRKIFCRTSMTLPWASIRREAICWRMWSSRWASR